MSDELGDDTIALRPPAVADAADHAEAARESWAEVSRWLAWCHDGYTEQESAAWIESVVRARQAGELYEWFIFRRADGRFLGGCSLRPLGPGTRVANCGYWLRTSASGSGIMTRAVRLVLAHGFEALGLERIEIIMRPENIASKRVAEKVGARFEGVLRKRIPWTDGNHDALCYAVVATAEP